MKYQTTATPITTKAEFDAARAAGAHIEYTGCGPGGCGRARDHYDMPQSWARGSGGWIKEREWFTLGRGELMRAFYPIPGTEEAK